jgi:hypothetical protein
VKRARRRKSEMRKVRRRSFEIALTDLPQVADAVFVGVPNRPGRVIMAVNTKGRICIDALFPQKKFLWQGSNNSPWQSSNYLPADWYGLDIDVANLVATTETRLPLEIIGSAGLDGADPDTLAHVLAVGVNRRGGRGVVYSREKSSRKPVKAPARLLVADDAKVFVNDASKTRHGPRMKLGKRQFVRGEIIAIGVPSPANTTHETVSRLWREVKTRLARNPAYLSANLGEVSRRTVANELKKLQARR